MNKEQIDLVADCAQELIRRIAEYEIAIKDRLAEPKSDSTYYYEWTEFRARQNPKLTGAIKRQSMELTRALANLRKSA